MERNGKASDRGRGLWMKVLQQLRKITKQFDKRPKPLKEIRTWQI